MSEPKLDTYLPAVWDWAVKRGSELKPRSLAWGGLALAGVIFLCLNLVSSIVLRNWQSDLTEDGLYTISDGSRAILKAIDEPISARLYFSQRLGTLAPQYASYFNRVRTLLEQYRDISGGKLQLTILDPEPFSDAEDRAVAVGLRGMRLNSEGELGYFGFTATNAIDQQETIPIFSPEREEFLEYDVTKLIHTLSNPKKRVVGIMTGLPIEGGKAPMSEQPLPVWVIMDQVREFFDVEKVEQTVSEIPATIDVLLVAQPSGLTPTAAYAIDQFAMKGGKILAFIDPVAESAQLTMLTQGGEGTAELAKLLEGWGVAYDPKKVAADIKSARRVQFGGRGGGQPMVTEFVAWLGLDKTNIDPRDVLSSGIEKLNLASAGILSKADGATATFTPILETSADAMQVGAEKIGMGADPIGLLRAYKPEGKRLTLAARLSGEAKSAFPDGPPAAGKKAAGDKKDDKPAEAPAPGDAKSGDTKSGDTKSGDTKSGNLPNHHLASGRINAVVVADTDMLANQFWVQVREVMGQQMQMPIAHNAAFVVGALENLTGSDALIALRGRGVKERRFTLVEDIRRDAERQFREKEQTLTAKLKTVEDELRKLETSGEGGGAILTDKEQQAVEKFRSEMLETRRELRDVKFALRRDIDRLGGWLKFVNIALVPLAIGFGGVGWSFWQRQRRKVPASRAEVGSDNA